VRGGDDLSHSWTLARRERRRKANLGKLTGREKITGAYLEKEKSLFLGNKKGEFVNRGKGTKLLPFYLGEGECDFQAEG